MSAVKSSFPLLKKKFVATASLVVLLVVVVFSLGKSLEYSLGLPLLYKLRNLTSPPPVPENVIIVTPFLSRSIEQPDALPDWDRTHHAKAIRHLDDLGVKVKVIDIYFRDQAKKGDKALARKLAQNSGTILNQLARTVNSESDPLPSNILRNPSSYISSSAELLAPSLLDAGDRRVDVFYPFFQIKFNRQEHKCFGYPADADLPNGVLKNLGEDQGSEYVATTPVIALERLAIATGQINSFLAAHPEVGAPDDANSCESFHVFRKRLANNTYVRDMLSGSNDVISAEATSTPPLVLNWLKTLQLISLPSLQRQSGVAAQFLNYYGPPRTFTTLDYRQLEEIAITYRYAGEDNPFNNAVVFIGGLFTESSDLKEDSFETVFSRQNEPMSGVEIIATAFANLSEGSMLRQHSPETRLLSVILVVGTVFLPTVRRSRTSVLIACTCMLSVSYIVFAVFLFRSSYLWLPVATPMVTAIICTMAAVLQRLFTTTAEKRRLYKDLKLYLSDSMHRQLTEGSDVVALRAICMVTDVEQFSHISNSFTAITLHQLNRLYFKQLFEAVNQYDADIIKTYGDSMTAVWILGNFETSNRAIEAGMEIFRRLDKFNNMHKETPFHTRIGVSMGEIVIGSVGDSTQQTVELTGTTVYEAARLEQYNKTLQSKFLVTRECLPHKHTFPTKYHGPIELRGISGTTDVVEVISET